MIRWGEPLGVARTLNVPVVKFLGLGKGTPQRRRPPFLRRRGRWNIGPCRAPRPALKGVGAVASAAVPIRIKPNGTHAHFVILVMATPPFQRNLLPNPEERLIRRSLALEDAGDGSSQTPSGESSPLCKSVPGWFLDPSVQPVDPSPQMSLQEIALSPAVRVRVRPPLSGVGLLHREEGHEFQLRRQVVRVVFFRVAQLDVEMSIEGEKLLQDFPAGQLSAPVVELVQGTARSDVKGIDVFRFELVLRERKERGCPRTSRQREPLHKSAHVLLNPRVLQCSVEPLVRIGKEPAHDQVELAYRFDAPGGPRGLDVPGRLHQTSPREAFSGSSDGVTNWVLTGWTSSGLLKGLPSTLS